MADKRAIATIGARAASGVIGIGVAVAVVGGATLLPLPQLAIGVPAETVRPVPADQQLLCPGALLTLAADAAEATRPTAIGKPAVTHGTDGPEAQTSTVTSGADTTSPGQAPQALTVTTPKGATTPPLFAGAQSQDVATETLSGLATASCSEPAADAWLVTGSTSLGQTSLLLLANPTTVDSSVDLEVFTETGKVDAPGGTGILVPSGAQVVVPISGLAPAAVAPVVHVTSTGGQVVATVQQSFEQGIQPRGVEMTGPTGAPARTQRISGVSIASLGAVTAQQSAESVGVEFPVVRILVPGDTDAQITIGAVGESGTEAGNSYAQTVKAGSVAEIPLDHLSDGSFTVTIHSSVPVVAAVRTSVIGTGKRDFSWFASSAPLGESQLVSVPAGPSPLLHFANPEDGDATVTVTPESGESFTVAVPAEGGANHRVAPGRYTVTGADGLTASVSFAADGATSSFPLNPPGPLAAPIEVYPR